MKKILIGLICFLVSTTSVLAINTCPDPAFITEDSTGHFVYDSFKSLTIYEKNAKISRFTGALIGGAYSLACEYHTSTGQNVFLFRTDMQTVIPVNFCLPSQYSKCWMTYLFKVLMCNATDVNNCIYT